MTWDSFQVDFTHTYEREGKTFTSTIDHFFISEQLSARVTDTGVLHHPDNTSDHEPVFCVINSIILTSSSIQVTTPKPRPSWRKASKDEKEMYRFLLDRKLEAIVVPTQIAECKDIKCKDPEHIEAVIWFSSELLDAVQRAGKETLPCPRAGSSDTRKPTPGFKEHVKPFKDKAYLWNHVWKSAGCPLNTELHKLMKKTRNVYHVEFKNCQKAEDNIKKSKLLDACLNGNGELFKEVKAMRRVKPNLADLIDGVKTNIPSHFKNVYSSLYNSVEDADLVKDRSDKIEGLINPDNMRDTERVTTDKIKKAEARLKPGKSDPTFVFSSDCLKVNSNVLADHTATMMKSFLVHNHIPQFMLVSTLIPIIKVKLASANNSKNYRSVGITSLVLKQLDRIIINLFDDCLGFHDLQFACQPGVSAKMCTWAVLETTNYFLENGSEVFACSMDKTKAFDLCQFSVLFKKMMKNLSLVFLRLIIFMYVNQFCNVCWGTETSSSFTIKNGMGQGKILAGFAYCYYCFDLFTLLQKSNFGCKING